jgi:hypothetical protein
LRRVGRWAKEHESLLLLVSATISSISMIMAAAAVYYTSRQVSLMYNEQLTPYKAALYNQRLEGYRQSLEAIAKFENSAICFKSIYLIEKNPVYQNEEFMNRLRECNEKTNLAYVSLNNDLMKNVFFWSKTGRYEILMYLVKAGDFGMCQYARPMSNAINIPEHLKRNFSSKCKRGTEAEWNELIEIRNRISFRTARMIDSGDIDPK